MKEREREREDSGALIRSCKLPESKLLPADKSDNTVPYGTRLSMIMSCLLLEFGL